MTDPQFATRDHYIELVRAAATQHVTIDTLTGLTEPVLRARADHMANRLVLTLAAKAQTERLPVQDIRHTWHGTHIFDLDKTITVPRAATWWDMFKDTYRTRWWLRAITRRWPARWVDMPVTVRDTFVRSCTHDIRIPVHAAWLFPQAPPLAGAHVGPAVLTTWEGVPTVEINPMGDL